MGFSTPTFFFFFGGGGGVFNYLFLLEKCAFQAISFDIK